jgi:hypothetical protein
VKIIIDNQSKLTDELVIIRVLTVIKGGLVSNGGRQHCYHSEFQDCHVSTYLNEKSERFLVTDK